MFAAATAVAVLHALDDAFTGRQPGVEASRHAPAALIAVALALVAVRVLPSLRPGLRSAVALLFGVAALVNGSLHVLHIAGDGAAHSDVTGVAAAAAGVVLLGLGMAIPWRHRRDRVRSAPARWTARVVALVAGVVVVFTVVLPVSGAIVQTHKHRAPVGDPPSAAYAEVAFRAADGLELAGWYRPSRNGAAVILVHGGGSDRTGSRAHAELLERHGYGVLLYDARGSGRSEGDPNAYGWGWQHDVAGALRFLGARPDVDPTRVGAIGLSTGADVLIGVAAKDRRLRAVVGDGATGASFADYTALKGVGAEAPFFWTLFTATRVLSGSSPPPRLVDDVARVSPTPLLLIASGRGVAAEVDLNRLYADAAREPVELWELPDVDHTSAIRQRAADYERRVVGFLDAALLGPRAAAR